VKTFEAMAVCGQFQYCRAGVSEIDTDGIDGGTVAGESARIVANVKAALKARGVTYAELAKRIGLSATPVKRALSRGTLSLQRVEQIGDAIGASVDEMAELALGPADRHPEMLTLGQEKALAGDPQLFACYHLVANGRSNREIEAAMQASAE